jgi:hypothetical protein
MVKMVKLSSYIYSIVFLLAVISWHGCMHAGVAKRVDIRFELPKERLKINGQIISGQVHYAKLLTVIGSGNRKVNSTSTFNKKYLYDSLGIDITTTHDTIAALWVSLAPPEDTTRHALLLNGTLSLDNILITSQTKIEDLMKINGVVKNESAEYIFLSYAGETSWQLFFDKNKKCFIGANFNLIPLPL